MKRTLLERLVCPVCRGALVLHGPVQESGEIDSGLLRCQTCHGEYPITHGVPRLVRLLSAGGVQVRNSFELQWSTWDDEERIFGRTRQDAMAYLATNLMHPTMTRESLRGKWVLDAGCGHGMYVRCLAECGAEVVGLDVGNAVTKAYDRVRVFPNAHGLQADVLAPALKTATFDYVFSNGVIHHTSDTRLAFSRLASLVRPGGYLGVWVYPFRHPVWEFTQRAIRAITTCLPRRVLRSLCYLPVPLLEISPAYSGTSLRTSTWRQCAQVVFDFYAPKYQSHHHPQEVQNWFHEEGFEDVVFMPDPLSVTGKRREEH